MATGQLMPPIRLDQVTLCAVSSVNVEATVRALEVSMAQAQFGRCLLLTDQTSVAAAPGIEKIAIAPLRSSAAYSNFVLTELAEHVATTHCLLVQWDGHVLAGPRWRDEFLRYDYIGASWPQFGDGHDVGNGGFSLRSRRLMELCRAPAFQQFHPEDIAIGRANRSWLETEGIRFAPRSVADRFSAERSSDPAATFGYHGTWLMPRVLGTDAFWEIYQTLDDRTTVNHDIRPLIQHLRRGNGGLTRALQLMRGYLRDRAGSILPRAPGWVDRAADKE